MKTAKQFRDEQQKAAENLPTETKKMFWDAMLKGKTLGEANKLVGINDLGVAAELVLQCHKTITIPKDLDEIK